MKSSISCMSCNKLTSWERINEFSNLNILIKINKNCSFPIYILLQSFDDKKGIFSSFCLQRKVRCIFICSIADSKKGVIYKTNLISKLLADYLGNHTCKVWLQPESPRFLESKQKINHKFWSHYSCCKKQCFCKTKIDVLS